MENGGGAAAESMDSLSSLIRLTGVQVPARARFVAEATVGSTLTGVTLGLVCGQVSTALLSTGPLVPFLMGSWIGSGLGLYAYWHQSCRSMEHMALYYPQILAHALWTEHRVSLDPALALNGRKLLGWIQQASMLSTRYAWAILASQSCRDDVAEVERQHRQQLIESAFQKQRQEVTSGDDHEDE